MRRREDGSEEGVRSRAGERRKSAGIETGVKGEGQAKREVAKQ